MFTPIQPLDLLRSFPSIDSKTNFRRFVPPNRKDTPDQLFVSRHHRGTTPAPRFIRKTNARETLVYVDGSCRQTLDGVRAGCAFVVHPDVPTSLNSSASSSPTSSHGGNTPPRQITDIHALGAVNFRLENCGPKGRPEAQTSNRALLRAVIAVLRFRFWVGEGCQRLVLATDSSYVVHGCTRGVETWARNGWRTAKGEPVKHRDLWEELLRERERWSRHGLSVQFWLIPGSLNTLADGFAKEAALMAEEERWAEPNPLAVGCARQAAAAEALRNPWRLSPRQSLTLNPWGQDPWSQVQRVVC